MPSILWIIAFSALYFFIVMQHGFGTLKIEGEHLTRLRKAIAIADLLGVLSLLRHFRDWLRSGERSLGEKGS